MTQSYNVQEVAPPPGFEKDSGPIYAFKDRVFYALNEKERLLIAYASFNGSAFSAYPEITHTGLNKTFINALTFDPMAEMVFWADNHTIFHCETRCTAPRSFTPIAPRGQRPTALATAKGFVYWSSEDNEGSIHKINFLFENASYAEVEKDVGTVRSLIIKDSSLTWIDASNKKIRQTDMNGSHLRDAWCCATRNMTNLLLANGNFQWLEDKTLMAISAETQSSIAVYTAQKNITSLNLFVVKNGSHNDIHSRPIPAVYYWSGVASLLAAVIIGALVWRILKWRATRRRAVPSPRNSVEMAETYPPVEERPMYHLAVLGDAGAGKTEITTLYLRGDLPPQYRIFEDRDYGRLDEVNGREVLVDLRDAHQEHYCVTQYQKYAHAYIIVYSVTSMESFRLAERLLWKLQRLTRESPAADRPVLLLGTKVDADEPRQVRWTDGSRIARKYNCRGWHELSALTDYFTLRTAIQDLVAAVADKMRSLEAAQANDHVS